MRTLSRSVCPFIYVWYEVCTRVYARKPLVIQALSLGVMELMHLLVVDVGILNLRNLDQSSNDIIITAITSSSIATAELLRKRVAVWDCYINCTGSWVKCLFQDWQPLPRWTCGLECCFGGRALCLSASCTKLSWFYLVAVSRDQTAWSRIVFFRLLTSSTLLASPKNYHLATDRTLLASLGSRDTFVFLLL